MSRQPVSIPYEIDLGCVGLHTVEVIGYIVRPLTGGFAIEIEGALIKVGELKVNLLPWIKEDTLSGMRTNIKSRYFSSVMPSLMRDGCADEGAPA